MAKSETLSETRQKFEEYYEEAYAGELKSILERQAAWKFWKDGRLQGLEEAAKIADEVSPVEISRKLSAKHERWSTSDEGIVEALLAAAAAIREKANG